MVGGDVHHVATQRPQAQAFDQVPVDAFLRGVDLGSGVALPTELRVAEVEEEDRGLVVLRRVLSASEDEQELGALHLGDAAAVKSSFCRKRRQHLPDTWAKKSPIIDKSRCVETNLLSTTDLWLLDTFTPARGDVSQPIQTQVVLTKILNNVQYFW